MQYRQPTATRFVAACLIAGLAAACTPTVKVEAPDKPIVINLNVKIEQEVRIKVDRDVDTLLQNNPDLF
ncbi:MAG TPA: YnbE family lipoprotein [Alphaproteobacteria bacterium]|nr:YnbE family lipoprotein [Alphaproteobacteria bacterium]